MYFNSRHFMILLVIKDDHRQLPGDLCSDREILVKNYMICVEKADLCLLIFHLISIFNNVTSYIL